MSRSSTTLRTQFQQASKGTCKLTGALSDWRNYLRAHVQTGEVRTVSDFVARSCTIRSEISAFSAGQKRPSFVGNIGVC